MAQGTYDTGNGRITGGSQNDRVTTSDLATLTNGTLEPITVNLRDAYRQTGGNGLRFWDGSFFDLTNATINAGTSGVTEFVGDVIIGRQNNADDYFILNCSNQIKPHFQFFNQGKIICNVPIQIINRCDLSGGEPGAQAQMRWQNNNPNSILRLKYVGPAFSRGSDFTLPDSNGFKPNGSAIILWEITPDVPIREIEWKDGYIDWRPQGTNWAAPTKGIFESKTWMKWLGNAGAYSVSSPLVFGTKNATFGLKLGNSTSYFLNGFFGFTNQLRLVFNNLSGFNMQQQMAVYQNVQTEAHVQFDINVVDDLGSVIENADIQITHKSPKIEQNTTVELTDNKNFILQTDNNGKAAIGNGDGNVDNNICIAAFRKWGGGANVDGAYSNINASGTSYVSQNEIIYSIRKWGKKNLLNVKKQFVLLGQNGDGKPSNDNAKLNNDNLLSAESAADLSTEINTNQDLYNHAYKHAFDTFSEVLVGIDGDCGDKDIDIDENATNIYIETTNKITIKSSNFTGNLKTTGVVNTVNGEKITGNIIDSRGNSFLSFKSIDSWTVYSSIQNRDTNTSPIGNGTTGNFRFNFNENTTYYLRLVSNGVTFFKEVTPTNSGETIADLSTQALLASQATKEQIADTVWQHENKTDITGLITKIDAIDSLIDGMIANGMKLTAAERTNLATDIEAAIINEDDGQKVIDAIVKAISKVIGKVVWENEKRTLNGAVIE